MNLTAAQLHLIRRALEDSEFKVSVTPGQRAAIREVCEQAGADCEREKFLIAFKMALVEVANELDVSYGAERDALLARLISVFIDELYTLARAGVRLADARAAVTSPTRLGLGTDSPAARL